MQSLQTNLDPPPHPRATMQIQELPHTPMHGHPRALPSTCQTATGDGRSPTTRNEQDLLPERERQSLTIGERPRSWKEELFRFHLCGEECGNGGDVIELKIYTCFYYGRVLASFGSCAEALDVKILCYCLIHICSSIYFFLL